MLLVILSLANLFYFLWKGKRANGSLKFKRTCNTNALPLLIALPLGLRLNVSLLLKEFYGDELTKCGNVLLSTDAYAHV